MEGGSEQIGRLVSRPCRRSDGGGPGGTARTPLLPPPLPPDPWAVPPSRGKARREQGAAGRREQASFGSGGSSVRVSLAEGETEESLSAVLVQLKISGHV